MLKLSVVIPVYNVEAYIEKCLRSLENQDIERHEYEIICINDGSPDKSRDVIMSLREEFNNIILIDQENKGVSDARNIGIEYASGNYLLFIDPDDYADENSFRRVLLNAYQHDAEVSFLGFSVINGDGEISHRQHNTENSAIIYTGIDAYSMARGGNNPDPDRMWAVLFKTEFLKSNNLKYLAGVPYLEDGEFITRILCLANRCIFDGNSFYQRTTRPGSATNSGLFFSHRATDGFLLAATNLKQFQQLQDLNERQFNFLNQPIVKFVILAINSSMKHGALVRIKQIIHRLKELSFNRLDLSGCSRDYLVYGKIYNISPFLVPLVILLRSHLNRLMK